MLNTLFYIILDIPVCLRRMIAYFSDAIRNGNVVCKLLITDIILPQTCIIAYIIGTIVTNINKMKIMPTQIFDNKFFSVHLLSLGHKPTISNPIRCGLTAHMKSNKF